MYLRTHAYTHTCTHLDWKLKIPTRSSLSRQAHTRIHTHTYTHTYTSRHTCSLLHTHLHAHALTHMIWNWVRFVFPKVRCVIMYSNVYWFIYICTNKYLCTCICTRTHILETLRTNIIFAMFIGKVVFICLNLLSSIFFGNQCCVIMYSNVYSLIHIYTNKCVCACIRAHTRGFEMLYMNIICYCTNI